jgi:diphthamide synthase (EF-2-diphthine--ammonia ligase)
MSNNKQSSSVEWLAVRLKEKMQVWNSTKNYQEFHIVLEAGEFAKLIEEAKAMHRREHADTARDWWVEGASDARKAHTGKYESFDDYYTEKFTAEQPA